MIIIELLCKKKVKWKLTYKRGTIPDKNFQFKTLLLRKSFSFFVNNLHFKWTKHKKTLCLSSHSEYYFYPTCSRRLYLWPRAFFMNVFRRLFGSLKQSFISHQNCCFIKQEGKLLAWKLLFFYVSLFLWKVTGRERLLNGKVEWICGIFHQKSLLLFLILFFRTIKIYFSRFQWTFLNVCVCVERNRN